MKKDKPKNKLSCSWFCTPPLDYEHKQYVLLDYVQKIKNGFKSKDLKNYYKELQYHYKNLECFLTVRNLLNTKDISPNKKERKLFDDICSLPDTDERLKTTIEVAKWAQEQLKEPIKDGAELIRLIESNLIMYYVGRNFPVKNNGYILIRYAGSDVFECFKFLYDSAFKDTSFEFLNYYELPITADFRDVKNKVLEQEGKIDDIFIAVESNISFDTKNSLLPVLSEIFPSKVFNSNIYGLPSF